MRLGEIAANASENSRCTKTPHGGSRAVFHGLVNTKYGRDVPWLFTGPKRPTLGIAHCFRAGPWRRRASLALVGAAGGRCWQAPLAGVVQWWGSLVEQPLPASSLNRNSRNSRWRASQVAGEAAQNPW